ncbi:WD40-repeat-containing domain protein [Mycena rosella]|uniref:WD repeat-containing protein JIP5 n=1 Tax=Mycena rosella TaxID=1033263 RepID=A0AAD7GSF8_MYCRO|nr:WD40-repeat-containing domain protein [Mycena rosella]
MPEIPVGAQIFDLVFHPTHSTVYTGLLTGHIKAFAYDQSSHKKTFSVRPSKRSCRALTINDDGTRLYAAGKGKAIHTIDTTTGDVVETRAGAHDDPINRIKHIMPWMFATGDDAGVIKLWDPRQQDAVRSHTQHCDYITDFLWLPDKHHLLATSGDGTLSVMDVRSKKTTPFAQSEDQDDELLSATTIKGGAKVVVGTQLGILSIFNRSSGYGDCVDRAPGHPSSIDALCALPRGIPGADEADTLLTGSADGLVRAVRVLPTRLLGVVADHGDLPVERIAVGGGGARLDLSVDDDDGDAGDDESNSVKSSKGKGKAADSDGEEEEDREEEAQGQGQWWVGSAGHDEVLRLTDLAGFFRNPGALEPGEGGADASEDDDDDDLDVGGEDREVEGENAAEDAAEDTVGKEENTADGAEEAEADADSDDDDGAFTAKKRKRKPEKDPLVVRRKKGKNEVDVQGAFFDGL